MQLCNTKCNTNFSIILNNNLNEANINLSNLTNSYNNDRKTNIGTFTFTGGCTGSIVSYQIGRVAILNISTWKYSNGAPIETTLTMGRTNLKPGMPVTFPVIRSQNGLVALGTITTDGLVTVRMIGNQGYIANEDLFGQAIYFI